MTKDERSNALDRRKDRIVQLVRQKKTVKEICDLLGLDPENEPKYLINSALVGTGLKAAVGLSKEWKPVGLRQGSSNFCTNLGHALNRLLEKNNHNYIAVAELTGLTQMEQKKALNKNRHDWTISQMQRLANGLDMSYAELIAEANAPGLSFTRSKYGGN